MCAGPGWMGLGAIFPSGRCSSPMTRGWNKMIFKIPSCPNYSLVLWIPAVGLLHQVRKANQQLRWVWLCLRHWVLMQIYLYISIYIWIDISDNTPCCCSMGGWSDVSTASRLWQSLRSRQHQTQTPGFCSASQAWCCCNQEVWSDVFYIVNQKKGKLSIMETCSFSWI